MPTEAKHTDHENAPRQSVRPFGSLLALVVGVALVALIGSMDTRAGAVSGVLLAAAAFAFTFFGSLK